MSSYSSSQKAFAGGGKVHGDALVMADFRRNDYNKIVNRLEKMANRMTVRKAINRAAKRAADTGVSITKRLIASSTTLKSSEVGKRVKAYAKGSPLDMSIGMRISDTARPLSEFAFSPKKPKRVPVTVEVYKGNKKTLNRGAFVAQMPSGHVGIYERQTDKALPIKSLPGPSVTGLFKANETIYQAVWNKIFETFEQRVDHEFERLLNG